MIVLKKTHHVTTELNCITNLKRVIIGNHCLQGTLSGRQPYSHRESQPPGYPVRETALQSSGITAPRVPCQGDSLTIIGNHSPQGTLSGRQPYNHRESQPPGDPVRETALQSSGITAPRVPCQGDSLTVIGNHSPQGTLSGRRPYNHRESQPPGYPVRETALQSSGITAPRGPCQGDSLTIIGNHSPQGTLSGRQPYNHRESQPPGYPVRETALQSSGITAPRGPCQGDSLTIIGNHSPQGTLSGRQPYNHRESQPQGDPVRQTALQSSGITAPRGPCQGDSLTIIGNHSPKGTLSGRQPYNHRESQPQGDPVRETALQSSGITAPRGPCLRETVLPSYRRLRMARRQWWWHIRASMPLVMYGWWWGKLWLQYTVFNHNTTQHNGTSWMGKLYLEYNVISHTELTHWGLVTPYDDVDLGQHWLR